VNAIRIENLQKYYGQVKAVDGLSLNVNPGTIFGFLGPNGAGKSTTLRILTGMAHPTGGQAWVSGISTRASHQVASHIGYLPEEPAFYNWMTPLEFLDHIGRLFSFSGPLRQKRNLELLQQVGLSEVSKRRIGGFSRGMRQRLGLAQAMYNHPEVLFLDEPVSALDPVGRKEVLDLIQQLRSQSTVFMSTHILADVERVCDTVGIIHHGKLIIEARQDELIAQYTIPAFELECDPGQENLFREWCENLKSNERISSVAFNGLTARVVVTEINPARQTLLTLAAQSSLALRRFEIVTPSLEDIFLRLVNGEEIIK
jgi:ABC-2 type transport system ATP-binding protein